MDADIGTPGGLCGSHVRCVASPFQRPYAWDDENRWRPLWDGIARAAELLDDRTDTPWVPCAACPWCRPAAGGERHGFVGSHSVIGEDVSLA